MKKGPPLLAKAAAFVAKQKHGALGWFDSFGPEPIPKAWDPDNAERLARAGLAFLSLPEGSLLALLETGDGPDAAHRRREPRRISPALVQGGDGHRRARRPHGHDEPKLDDATWEAVDRASSVLDEQFARWLT